MYAISLWQPWATAVVTLGKNVENRTWAPPHWLVGQRIAIHAALTIDKNAMDEAREQGVDLPDDLPTGALLGTVRLIEAHQCSGSCSDWAEPDRWHWMLDDPRPLPSPLACAGRQRLWKVPPELG